MAPLIPAFCRATPIAVVRPSTHEYLRVNTIFEVVRAHGGYTAWTDKHPAYEWTNGPSGDGVDDFFGPEINSIPVALPYPGCNPVNAADPAPDDGWTTDLKNIQCYDETHVQAIRTKSTATRTMASSTRRTRHYSARIFSP